MKRKRLIAKILLLVPLTLGACFAGLPVLWMISSSFKPNQDIFQSPPHLVPERFTVDAYLKVLTDPTQLRFFGNSYLVSLSVTLLTLLVAVMAAYVFSRYEFPLKRFLNVLIISVQAVPPITLLIPYFGLIIALRLYDSYQGLILTYMVFTLPYAIIMMTGYFNTLPRELDEAVRIDGGNSWTVLWRILVPVSVPGLVSVGIYTFMIAWNEYLFALTLTKTVEMRTVPIGIQLLMGQHSYEWSQMMAMSILGSIPILILFVFFQRYFIGGMTAGAVKNQHLTLNHTNYNVLREGKMLTTGDDILRVANNHNFAVPAFNISDYAMFSGIADLCEDMRAPWIVAIHPDEYAHVGPSFIKAILDRAHKSSVPMAVHLDHGADMTQVLTSIQQGYTSVMIDASLRTFEENIAITKEVSSVAHAVGLSVEGELGTIGANDSYGESGVAEVTYTDPEDAAVFVERTGVDSLAIAIGTFHGLYPAGAEPKLKLDLLRKIKEATPVPLVLHGGSSNPDEEIREAARLGINKINISSDIKVAYHSKMREVLGDDIRLREPLAIQPQCVEAMKEVAAHKIDLFGATNRADLY